MPESEVVTELKSLVEHWIETGLISPEQGERILAEHQKPLQVNLPHGSLMAEALAYIGGMLILVATIIIVSIYWPSLGPAERSALTGGATAVVLGAGILLPRAIGTSRRRLRAVLWALAVALCGLWIGVTADGMRWRDETAILIAAGAAALLAAVLYGYQKTSLQLAAMAIALAVASGAAAAHLPRVNESTIGLALWGLGLPSLALTWGGLLRPQRTAFLLGGAALVAGGQLTAQYDWGLALAGASVTLLVAAAVGIRDLWLLGVGAVGVLITVPFVMNRFFPGELAAPLALLGAGAALIVLGVVTARRRRAHGETAVTVTIAPTWAVLLAVCLTLATVPAVLIAGGLTLA